MTLVYVVSLVYLHIYPLGAAINLISEELACTELDRTFPLTLDPPSKGLPDGAILIRHSSSIPPGVSKILPPLLPWCNIHHQTVHQILCGKGYRQTILLPRIVLNSVSHEISFVHPVISHSKI